MEEEAILNKVTKKDLFERCGILIESWIIKNWPHKSLKENLQATLVTNSKALEWHESVAHPWATDVYGNL